MIYLNPEVVSGLGEDTFWTWFKREFPTSVFGVPRHLAPDDIVLQYSTLGFVNRAGKSLALLWELIPEMKAQFKSNEWDSVLARTYESARFCTYRTVTSHLMVPYYEQYGTIDVLPIGVNTDLFKPLGAKDQLRSKYGIPRDKIVGFWAGTTHPMKGFSQLLEYGQQNPEVHWVIVWKQQSEAGDLPGASNFVHVPQETLCELLNTADFFLSCGTLRPFYMIEWEAMACNLPLRLFDPTLEKDFSPSENPREDVFRLKWDRPSAKQVWAEYLANKGVKW